jgi:hypothetical protein
MIYNYVKTINSDQLASEIRASAITVALDSINTVGDDVEIIFKAELLEAEVTILNALVSNHIVVFQADAPFQVAIAGTEIDTEGRQIVRAAAGKKGWTYLAHSLEFETAKVNSLQDKDYLGNISTASSIKFYDVNNNEITDSQYEADIVKTVVLFKPAYDYELISGHLHQIVCPVEDLRVWVVGGLIELGGVYVKEFARNLNMKFIGADEELTTDGRACKYMAKNIQGVPYQGNQLQLIIKHSAGFNHKLMLLLEYFRA